MRKIFTIVISVVFILGIMHLVQIAWAQGQENQTRKEAANVGNKICPVSEEKIDEKLKATYEYQGKVYNFCCPACIEEFKKDPKEYIKKVEEEQKSKPSMMEESGHMYQEDTH
jgi:YHS domain-containing protein